MISELRGVNFRPKEAKEIVKSLAIETTLTLERDSGNEYDENAVKVLYEDQFIGFVAKEDAAEIGPRMDSGEEFICYVESRVGDLKLLLSIEPEEDGDTEGKTENDDPEAA